jgi:hypothetical protein
METVLKIVFFFFPSEELSNRICAVRFHKKWSR